MKTECSFYTANGKHCTINDDCVVCKATDTPRLEKGEVIQLVDFGPLDGTYRIEIIKNGRLKLELVHVA